MTLPRRRFLGIAGAGAAGLMAGDATASAASAAGLAAAPVDGFGQPTGPLSDVAVLRAGYEAPPAVWDMTWVDRVTGKHRAVFDSPGVSDGAAVFRAVMWRNQYKEVYSTEPADTTAIVVIRHTGIVLGMNAKYWERFEPGKAYKIKNDEGKNMKVNPVAGPAEGTPNKSQYNIPGFIASGGIVLACGLAFSGIVGDFRKKDKLSREEADKVAREHLLPGVILQPSGVFAVMRAQEAGCQFMVAS